MCYVMTSHPRKNEADVRFSRAVASLVGLAVADWVGAALEFLEAYRGAWGIAGIEGIEGIEPSKLMLFLHVLDIGRATI